MVPSPVRLRAEAEEQCSRPGKHHGKSCPSLRPESGSSRLFIFTVLGFGSRSSDSSAGSWLGSRCRCRLSGRSRSSCGLSRCRCCLSSGCGLGSRSRLSLLLSRSILLVAILSAVENHTESVNLAYSTKSHHNNTQYLPGSHPRRVKQQFNKTAHVQHPFSIATAIGGRKMANKILHTSS